MSRYKIRHWTSESLNAMVTVVKSLLLGFFIYGFGVASAAESGKEILLPHFQNPLLQTNKNIETTESIIDHNGIKFRKVEYRGKSYYLQILENKESAANLQMYCEGDKPLIVPRQVLIAKRVTKRSHLFIEGLQAACVDMQNGKKMLTLNPSISVGFMLDDQPKDIFKNKKVYLMPRGLSFSGDF